MSWFDKNIVFFILSLLPIFCIILLIYLLIKSNKSKNTRMLNIALVSCSIFNLIIFYILLNIIISYKIEISMLKHYEQFIGKPAGLVKFNSKSNSINVDPWYSIKPYIFYEEIYFNVENDTIKSCFLCD
jgi:hypothetical protein